MPVLSSLLLATVLQVNAPAGFLVGVPGVVEWDRKRIYMVSSVAGKLKVSTQEEVMTRKERSFAKRSLGTKLIKVNLGRGEAKFRFIPGEGQKYKDGELFHAEMGEWSGTLVFNKAGMINPEILIKDNIKAIGIDGDVIYAITGLAHLSIKTANLYKVTKQNGKWNSTKLTDIEDCPLQAMWTGKSFVYVTNNYVGDMNTMGQLRILKRFHTEDFGFYSIVRTDDGNTWLGGLGSIGCLSPKIIFDQYEYTSFVPLLPTISAKKKG